MVIEVYNREEVLDSYFSHINMIFNLSTFSETYSLVANMLIKNIFESQLLGNVVVQDLIFLKLFLLNDLKKKNSPVIAFYV